jgi:hypothetical protein
MRSSRRAFDSALGSDTITGRETFTRDVEAGIEMDQTCELGELKLENGGKSEDDVRALPISLPVLAEVEGTESEAGHIRASA